jgi:O-antigen/teichoic acid export membrane protein
MNPVIATVLLDPPSTLMFGTALAALSWKQLRANPHGALKKVVLISAAWSAWYGVCVSWYFFARPDWMFTYLLDTQSVPLVPAFIVFMAAMILYGVLGALGTGLLMQQGKSKLAVLSVIVAFASFGLIFAMGFNAYTHVGTYAQYIKGEAPALELDSSMKMAMNISTVGIVVSILVSIFVGFRKPRAA